MQTKPEVGKGISSESRGVAEAQGRNFFANQGLGLQRHSHLSLLNKKKFVKPLYKIAKVSRIWQKIREIDVKNG